MTLIQGYRHSRGMSQQSCIESVEEKENLWSSLSTSQWKKKLTNLHQRFPKGLESKLQRIKRKSHVTYLCFLRPTNSLKRNLCLSMERLWKKCKREP